MREQKQEFVTWLDRRKNGDLIFTDRPYATYRVYVKQAPDFEEYRRLDAGGNERLSGKVTIRFAAYEPFAKLNVNFDTTLTDDDLLSKAVHRLKVETGYLGLMHDPMTVSRTMAADGSYSYSSLTPNQTYLVMNPGTETAYVNFEVAGDVGGDGLTITNTQTGQTCGVVALAKAVTTSVSRWYCIDSKTGRCYLTNGVSESVDFSYHDYGYIGLAPADMISDITIRTVASSSNVQSVNHEFTPEMKGKYSFHL